LERGQEELHEFRRSGDQEIGRILFLFLLRKDFPLLNLLSS